MTKLLNRRSVIAGTAAALAATGVTAGPALAASEDDAQLRQLWAEYTNTWASLQEAYPKEHQARRAAYQDKKRLPPAYFYEHITPADEKARRRWVAVERLHPNSDHHRRRPVWRKRAIPGTMSCTEAIAFAKQRLDGELEVHCRKCREIRAWHGVDEIEAETASLRERLKELRLAIRRIPAKTLFGVGVRLVANSHGWEDDHHAVHNCTMATVGKLAGTEFKLPTLRA